MRTLHRIVVLLATALASGPLTTYAQTYPTKPIRVIVPFSAGSATDVLTRVVGAKMAEAWGQQVVVDTVRGPAASSPPKPPRPARRLYAVLHQQHHPGRQPQPVRETAYDPVKDFT